MNQDSDKARRSPFGELLRQFRLRVGLSQEALAERALISVDGISALERGRNRAPQRETLALLVRALGLDAEQQRAFEEAAARPARPRAAARRLSKRTNLPQVDGFLYGRERETKEVLQALDRRQIVTLTGTGGIGKTRLALQVGSDSMAGDRFSDGVWFVDLSTLRDPKLAPSAVAAVFSVTESSGRSLLDSLVAALKEKRVLLILDNCEHILADSATLVRTLARANRRIRILATSRQSLGIPGEYPYRVASLEAAAGMALFEDRANRVNRAFEITNENHETIARICLRLDGIPFAIELAAARLTVLTPQQIEERLAERFRILMSNQLALPRRQTMRALIDWSYELLSANEKTLFARLGVFAGGFSIDAVAAVCSESTTGEWNEVDLLASLVDKSLVVSEQRGRSQRYRLLESIRAYALERSAAEEERLKRRHAEYYVRLAQLAEEQFATALSTTAWAAELALDLEDVRAALDWTLKERGDIELGVRLLTALRNYWSQLGLSAEAARRAEDIIESVGGLPPRLQAAFWSILGQMRGALFGPKLAYEASARARELYEALNDKANLAVVIRDLGIASARLGRMDEAGDELKEALALSQAYAGQRDVVRALACMASFHQLNGQFDEARMEFLQVNEIAQDSGDELLRWSALVNLAEIDFALGDAQAAAAHAFENLEGAAVHINARVRSNIEGNLSAYVLALERESDAYSIAIDAIRDGRQAGDGGHVAIAVQHLAAAIARQDPRRAARLLGYVDRILHQTGYTREYTERFTHDMLMSRLRASMSEDEIARVTESGAAMTEDQAVRLAERKHSVTAEC